MRRKKHSSAKVSAQYQEMHSDVRRKMQAAKEEWIQNKSKAIEKDMLTGNNKQAYITLKSLTKTSQQRATVVKDENGKLLTVRRFSIDGPNTVMVYEITSFSQMSPYCKVTRRCNQFVNTERGG